jgi:hypothetical protein
VRVLVSCNKKKAFIYVSILKSLFQSDISSLKISEQYKQDQNIQASNNSSLRQASDEPVEKKTRIESPVANSYPLSSSLSKENTTNTLVSQHIDKNNTSTLLIPNIQKTVELSTQNDQSKISTTSQHIESTSTDKAPIPIKIKQERDMLLASIMSNNPSVQSKIHFPVPGTSSEVLSSNELRDLPESILQKINIFSEDHQQIQKEKNRNVNLLDDSGGNICGFLLSKDKLPSM